MTKNQLLKVIASCTHTTISEKMIIDAVDSYVSYLFKEHNITRCNELLFQIANDQAKLMQPIMAESQIEEAFKNFKALAIVKELIEEYKTLQPTI